MPRTRAKGTSCNHGRLALVTADGCPSDFDANLLGYLQLHGLIVEFRDLHVDASGGNHAIVDFQAAQELLHLLLLALHRQKDDEVKDCDDEHERNELYEKTAAALGRRRQRPQPVSQHYPLSRKRAAESCS